MPTIPRKQTPNPNRKKQERNYPQDKRYWSPQWRKLRATFIKKNPLCVDCGKLASVVDHIHSVRQGGSFYDMDNLQAMCHRCHNAKSGREAHQKSENPQRGSPC